MAEDRHPRVFISYRHLEKTDGPDAEAFNRDHVAWVKQFALDLSSYQVEPVLDMRLRQLVGNLFGTDPATEPAIANLALACLAVCHAYLPILTPGFAERIGYGGFQYQKQWQDGYLFDEWQVALATANAGKIGDRSDLAERAARADHRVRIFSLGSRASAGGFSPPAGDGQGEGCLTPASPRNELGIATAPPPNVYWLEGKVMNGGLGDAGARKAHSEH